MNMQQYVLCVVEQHVTVSNIKVLHENAFMANLCGRQQHVIRYLCKVSRYFCNILTKFAESWQALVKVPQYYQRLTENPSRGSYADTCGQTEGYMTDLTGAFTDYAKAPKNFFTILTQCLHVSL